LNSKMKMEFPILWASSIFKFKKYKKRTRLAPIPREA
jgi:hypothetical protein